MLYLDERTFDEIAEELDWQRHCGADVGSESRQSYERCLRNSPIRQGITVAETIGMGLLHFIIEVDWSQRAQVECEQRCQRECIRRHDVDRSPVRQFFTKVTAESYAFPKHLLRMRFIDDGSAIRAVRTMRFPLSLFHASTSRR